MGKLEADFLLVTKAREAGGIALHAHQGQLEGQFASSILAYPRPDRWSPCRCADDFADQESAVERRIEAKLRFGRGFDAAADLGDVLATGHVRQGCRGDGGTRCIAAGAISSWIMSCMGGKSPLPQNGGFRRCRYRFEVVGSISWHSLVPGPLCGFLGRPLINAGAIPIKIILNLIGPCGPIEVAPTSGSPPAGLGLA